jgi:hypothetical protein
MPIHVIVRGAQEIARKFGNRPARAAMWQNELEEETTLLKATAEANSATFTGDLRRSWEGRAISTGTSLLAAVGSPLEYAPYVEEGRKPGRQPPPDAIEAWVARRGGSSGAAFMLARSIAARGTQPKRMLGDAVDHTLPARLALRHSLMSRLIQES